MSWITKAESLLNNIDQKAASVLQNQQKNDGNDNFQNFSKIQTPSAKNMLILNKSTANTTLKRPSSKISDHDYDSFSEKSVSSRHTVVDNQNDEYIYMKDPTPVEIFSTEKELASTKILLSELKIENNELKMEIESLHEQLKISNNAQKTNELESAYAIIMNEKKDLTMINQSLENSNANYIKTISELESNIMKLQQKEIEMKHNLEYSKKETADINTELQNYKVRAQNQLQMKEKLIEQLKSGSSQLEENFNNDDNNSSTLQIEIEQLKNDRDHLESELNLLTKRYKETKSFIEKLEHKHRMAEAAAEDKINSLNETISQFALKSTQYEDEIRLLKQENENFREEMFKQKTLMTTKLHEKENELKRLKNSYRESQANSEIENRVQSLTQSLITKQNNLETITAERNAMKLQYEKLSKQHEELLLQMRNQRPQVINMNINETDDVKSNFLTINPFDSHMSKKVKRAYSNFDQLGIRISRYLNRYPLARLFSVFYVFFLHLFVLLVLLQSTPSQ